MFVVRTFLGANTGIPVNTPVTIYCDVIVFTPQHLVFWRQVYQL